MPLIMWSGISNAYYASVLMDLMARTIDPKYSDTKKNEMALFAMSLIGMGGFFGGQVVGIFRDKYGIKKAILVEVGLLVATSVIVDVFNAQNQFGPLAYVMCFAWGFQDSGCQCLLRCVLGFQFESKIIPFSVFNFI